MICLPVIVNNFSLLHWSIREVTQIIYNPIKMAEFCVRLSVDKWRQIRLLIQLVVV